MYRPIKIVSLVLFLIGSGCGEDKSKISCMVDASLFQDEVFVTLKDKKTLEPICDATVLFVQDDMILGSLKPESIVAADAGPSDPCVYRGTVPDFGFTVSVSQESHVPQTLFLSQAEVSSHTMEVCGSEHIVKKYFFDVVLDSAI